MVMILLFLAYSGHFDIMEYWILFISKEMIIWFMSWFGWFSVVSVAMSSSLSPLFINSYLLIILAQGLPVLSLQRTNPCDMGQWWFVLFFFIIINFHSIFIISFCLLILDLASFHLSKALRHIIRLKYSMWTLIVTNLLFRTNCFCCILKFLIYLVFFPFFPILEKFLISSILYCLIIQSVF